MQQHPFAPSTASLHTAAFNDLEDELFGAPGTADRAEYDAALELAMIPNTIKAYRLQHKPDPSRPWRASGRAEGPNL